LQNNLSKRLSGRNLQVVSILYGVTKARFGHFCEVLAAFMPYLLRGGAPAIRPLAPHPMARDKDFGAMPEYDRNAL